MSVTIKLWRTLLRVVSVNNYKDEVGVIIPGWDSSLTVYIPMHRFPPELKSLINKDFRFFAKVNIGAERWQDLKFEDWEWNGIVYTPAKEIEETKNNFNYDWPKGKDKSRFENLDD